MPRAICSSVLAAIARGLDSASSLDFWLADELIKFGSFAFFVCNRSEYLEMDECSVKELESGEIRAICTAEGKEYIYRVGYKLCVTRKSNPRCGALYMLSKLLSSRS